MPTTADDDVQITAEGLHGDPSVWAAIFTAVGLQPGRVGILCSGGDPDASRLACFAAFGALSTVAISSSETASAFPRVVVVLPPISVLGKAREQVSHELIEASTALVMEVRPLRDKAAVAQKLSQAVGVRQAPTLLTADLLACLGNVPDQALVLVSDAALYHTPHNSPPGDAVANPDTWIARVAHLTSSVAAWAHQNKACVVIDCGRLLPLEHLRVELCPPAVSNATLIGGLPDTGRLEHIATEFDRGVEYGIRAVGDIPDLPEWQRAVLTSQHLSRLRRPLDAFQAYIRFAKDILDRSPSEVLIAMGRIALNAGQREAAARIAARVRVEELNELRALHQAHYLGHVLGLDAVSRPCADRLLELFPHSLEGLSAKLTALVRDGDYNAVSVLLGNDTVLVEGSPELRAVRTMAEMLGRPAPDYQAILSMVSGQAPAVADTAAALLLRHAVDSGRPLEALALSEPCAMTDGLAAGILHAIERYMLSIADGDVSQLKPTLGPISRVVTFAARDPSLVTLRGTLSRAVSPALVGFLGPVLLVSLFNERYTLPPLLPPVTRGAAASEDELIEWLLAFYETCRPNDTWIIGAFEAHDIPSPDTARWLLPTYITFLHHLAAREQIPEDDLHLLGQYAFIGILIARRAGSPEDEFHVLSAVGTAFARLGYHQGARDLAEHTFALSTGVDATARRRLAWHCYADLYQRVHSPVDALLGLVCMATADGGEAVTITQAWAEVATVVRTLRDLHLWDDAKSVLVTVRAAFEQGALFDTIRPRWEFLRVSVDAMMLASEGSEAPPDQVQLVCDDVATVLQHAVSERDELLPILHLATQMRAVFSTFPSASAVLETALVAARPSASLPETKFVDAMLGDGVPLDEIVAALAPHRTRYAHDLGTDLLPLALAARRCLTAAARRADLLEIVFATECLALHSATARVPVGRSSTPSGDRHTQYGLAPITDVLLKTVRDCESLVSDCVRSMSLDTLALDTEDQLVRVSVRKSGARTLTIGSRDTFSTEALKLWKRDNPRALGIDDPSDPFGDKMAASMKAIGIGPTHDEDQLLLLLDAELQSLPANLLWAGHEHLGAVRPVAAIPSLGWLRSSRTRVRTGKRHGAWIGGADPNPMSPLSILKTELQPVLDGLGIESIDNVEQPWSDIEVAIVAAHGGLYDSSLIGTPMFRSVADEAMIRMSPQELCDAIGTAKVVVLFICSGGRVDTVPLGRELVGVPVTLLRAGVQTVIASPWPLYVGVPAPWLRAFWETLLRGDSVGHACFRANSGLRSRYPHPSRWLAMHVYGDPLATLTPQAM